MAMTIKIESAKFIGVVSESVKQVENGLSNPMELFIALRELKKYIDDIETSMSDIFMTEAEKYNNDVFNGYEVRISNGSGRYTYDHIPEIRDLQRQLKTMQELAKHSYKLKNHGAEMMDEDGVLILPAEYNPTKGCIQLRKKGT